MYLKFLALIFTFLSLLLCSKLPIISPQWFSLFSAMLMTHFALSFYYSKDYIDLFFHQKKYLLLTSILLGSILLFIYQPILLYFYFGLHFMLSEVYSIPDLKDRKDYDPILIMNMLFYLSFYLVIFKETLYTKNIMYTQYIPSYSTYLFFASCFGLLIYSIKNKISFSIENHASHFICFSLVCFTLYFQLPRVIFLVCIMYHVIHWIFLGYTKLPLKKAKKFVIFNIILTSSFYIFTSEGLQILEITFASPTEVHRQWEQQITFWGIIHISFTFFISRLNPSYLRRFLLE